MRPWRGVLGGGVLTVADNPDYIAFRVPEGRGLLTVVAEVQPQALGGSSWAVWYSTLTPTGELRKVPVNHSRLGMNSRIAKTMIDVISSGGSLPADFVEQLPVVKV
jgi:hypothetical protein